MAALKWYIPGIVSIRMVVLEKLLRDLIRRSEAGMTPVVFGEAVDVEFYGTPVCEVETTVTKSGPDVMTTLRFVTNTDFSIGCNVGFIVEDASGVRHLVGVREQPCPMVETKSTSGTPDGRRACECKVTWPHAPIEILDNSFAT